MALDLDKNPVWRLLQRREHASLLRDIKLKEMVVLIPIAASLPPHYVMSTSVLKSHVFQTSRAYRGAFQSLSGRLVHMPFLCSPDDDNTADDVPEPVVSWTNLTEESGKGGLTTKPRESGSSQNKKEKSGNGAGVSLFGSRSSSRNSTPHQADDANDAASPTNAAAATVPPAEMEVEDDDDVIVGEEDQEANHVIEIEKNQGFPEDRTLSVLGVEENFSEIDGKACTYQLVYIDSPTEGPRRIVPKKVKLPKSRRYAIVHKFLHSFPENELILRKANEEICKFKQSYLFVKGYVDVAGTKVAALCEKTLEQLVCTNQEFRSYYHGTDKQLSELTTLVDSYVLGGMFHKLREELQNCNAADDEALRFRMEHAQHITPADVGCRKECANMSLVKSIEELRSIHQRATCPMHVLQGVGRAVEFLANPPGPQDAAQKTVTSVSTDDIIPLFIVALIRAQWDDLCTMNDLVTHFVRQDGVQQFSGRTSYYLTTLQAAVQFILSDELVKISNARLESHRKKREEGGLMVPSFMLGRGKGSGSSSNSSSSGGSGGGVSGGGGTVGTFLGVGGKSADATNGGGQQPHTSSSGAGSILEMVSGKKLQLRNSASMFGVDGRLKKKPGVGQPQLSNAGKQEHDHAGQAAARDREGDGDPRQLFPQDIDTLVQDGVVPSTTENDPARARHDAAKAAARVAVFRTTKSPHKRKLGRAASISSGVTTTTTTTTTMEPPPQRLPGSTSGSRTTSGRVGSGSFASTNPFAGSGVGSGSTGGRSRSGGVGHIQMGKAPSAASRRLGEKNPFLGRNGSGSAAPIVDPLRAAKLTPKDIQPNGRLAQAPNVIRVDESLADTSSSSSSSSAASRGRPATASRGAAAASRTKMLDSGELAAIPVVKLDPSSLPPLIVGKKKTG